MTAFPHRDWITAGIGVITLVGFAFGYRPSEKTESTPGAPRPRMVVAYFPNITHAIPILAAQRGEFERSLPEFTFDYKVVTNGPEALEALLAGAVDAAYVGPNPALNTYFRSDGKALRIIGAVSSGGISLVARDGTGIRGLADLAGRRVAVPQIGSTQDISLRAFIAPLGLRGAEKGGSVSIMAIKNPDVFSLFLQKQLDAAWVPEPWASRIELEAGGYRVLDERDLWPGRRFMTTVLVVRTEFANQYPQIAEGLQRADQSAFRAMLADPALAKRDVNLEIKRLTGKPLPPKVLDQAWRNVDFTTELDRGSIATMANRAHEQGFLKGDISSLEGVYTPQSK